MLLSTLVFRELYTGRVQRTDAYITLNTTWFARKRRSLLLPDDGIGTGEDILTPRTHSTNPFIGVAVIIRRKLNHNDITVSDVRKNAIYAR